MAIRFTDKGKEPESEPSSSNLFKGAKGNPPRPAPEPQAEAVQPDPPGGMPDGQLPFAKPKGKSGGRKPGN